MKHELSYIGHNSKSKKDNLNVYIYFCDNHVVSERMSSKEEPRKTKTIKASPLLNMYNLYCYKYVYAKLQLINTFKEEKSKRSQSLADTICYLASVGLSQYLQTP